MNYKPNVFLTSNVFREIGDNKMINRDIRKKIKILWEKLNNVSNLKVYNGRFPTERELKDQFEDFKPNILGCHLSHHISSKLLEFSNIFAILTSTAGFNHIQRPEDDNILIIHTPGILYETVADYTIAIIMANLRNLIDLHNYIWDGEWTSDDKWDLDQNLSTVINNKTLGIVGLGEIGKEVVRKLYPWGLKIIYHSRTRHLEFKRIYPKIEYKEKLEDIFKEADIISLHIPLDKSTENLINQDLLKKMKKNDLLVNTARGAIINLKDLLDLLEKKEIQINICFDVYPQEPIDAKTLEKFKKIKREQPNIRIILLPHNASADADTRGKMVILFLEDLIKIIKSSEIDDLNNINLIPEHKKKLFDKNWRIYKYWNQKLK